MAATLITGPRAVETVRMNTATAPAVRHRLVTRSDFDGLVCAALLKELGLLDDILFVHPKDMQDGKIEVGPGDITTNLPYVPGVGLAFDHHASEAIRVEDSPENHIIQPDAMFTGGITGAVQIARMAQVAGLEFAPHTWSGNGIGLAANLHVLGATHGAWLEYPYDPPSFVVETRDAMLQEPILVDADGTVALPQKPGLGIDLNIEAIEKFGTPI